MKARWPLALALVLFTLGAARDGLERWIARTELPPLLASNGVEVHDRHGMLLRAYTVEDGRWRLGVTQENVDPLYLQMLLRAEDKRFYQHSGVDLWAMARAAVQAVRHGEVISGGSTLTMQVARLLEDSGTGKWRGKLRQVRVALALEQRLSKRSILDLYLARAPFGGNLEGVRAATLAYFGKKPARLTPAEAALLVALPQSPETRRPDRHPDRATQARDRVLERMKAHGIIEGPQFPPPVPSLRRPFPKHAPHVSDRLVAASPVQTVHRTTLDAPLQAALERLAAQAARRAGLTQSAAILVADHRTGEILASVGSAGVDSDARQGFVDMTRALRSPGSTLKPLVYALAFDQGLAHPETLIEDRPRAFGSYVPVNFDGAYRGRVRVREALQLSLNLPVVALTEALGPTQLTTAMRRAGMDPVIQGGTPGLAVSLGGVGVSLHDLTELYASLAQGGRAVPLFVAQDDARKERPRARVVSDVAAWQVGHVLAGIAPPLHAMRRPLAYKTGTSYGHRDAWAIGFDGAHVIGVWMGRADGTPVPGAFGGELAAPLLFEAFDRLNLPPTPLPPPPAAVLLSSNSDLPAPLRQFGQRSQHSARPIHIAFPPDGAQLASEGDSLVVKLRDGTPPFTWLANGRPVLQQVHRREATLSGLGLGFVDLTVIDAQGQAARAHVRLDP